MISFNGIFFENLNPKALRTTTLILCFTFKIICRYLHTSTIQIMEESNNKVTRRSWKGKVGGKSEKIEKLENQSLLLIGFYSHRPLSCLKVMGGVGWWVVAHKFLVTAQSPNSSFPLSLRALTWDLDSGLSIIEIIEENSS